jgi:hypothetical protein
MAVNTGNIAKALQVGVNKFWGMGYSEHPLELSEIFDEETSQKAYEEDVQLVGTGLVPIKAQGAAVSYDNIRQGYVQRYTNLTYALGIIFTYEMLQDKQYDLGFKQAKYLGFSARQTQETVAANVLNRAFNASYTFADGVELCSAVHPKISGGTFSNELATAADLSHASIEQALIDIDNFTNDRGLKIAVKGKKLILPTALRFEAARILKSVQESGTANNDINAVRSEGLLSMAVNHYLTDSDAWFIKTDCMDGMKRIVRERVSAPVSENDFDTYNAKFKCMFRESYGNTDPRGVFGSPGA